MRRISWQRPLITLGAILSASTALAQVQVGPSPCAPLAAQATSAARSRPATNAQGYRYIVWSDAGEPWFRAHIAGSWSEAIDLDGSLDLDEAEYRIEISATSGPTTAMPADRAVYVVWESGSEGEQRLYFAASTNHGAAGSWSAPLQVDDTLDTSPHRWKQSGGPLGLSIASNNDGAVYIAYTNASGGITFRANSGWGADAAWGPFIEAPDSQTVSASPLLSADGPYAHLAWASCVGGSCAIEAARTQTAGASLENLLPAGTGIGNNASLQGLVSRGLDARVAWKDGTTVRFNSASGTDANPWRFPAASTPNLGITSAFGDRALGSNFVGDEYIALNCTIAEGRVCIVRSEDYGATWTLPIGITGCGTTDAIRHAPHLYAEGCRVYVTFDDYVYGDEGISLQYSATRGEAWLATPLRMDCDPGHSEQDIERGAMVGTERHEAVATWLEYRFPDGTDLPLSWADGDQGCPMTRDYWSGFCPVAACTNLSVWDDFVARFEAFSGLGSGQICNVLADTSTPEARLRAEFMGLLLNLASGNLAYCQCVDVSRVDTSCIPNFSFEDQADLEGFADFVNAVLSRSGADDACLDSVAGLVKEINDPAQSCGAVSTCLLANGSPTCTPECLPPFECGGLTPTTVEFDVDFSDPDGDALTLSSCTVDPPTTITCSVTGSTVHVTLPAAPLGNYTVLVTVDDGHGHQVTCDRCVVVQDTTPPDFTCPLSVPPIVPATGCCVKLTKADFGLTDADDGCDGLTPIDELWNTLETSFCAGKHTVVLESHDGSGNVRVCEIPISVEVPTPVLDCSNVLVAVPGGFRVDFPKPAFCDGTCCTLFINDIPVADQDIVRYVYDIEERMVVMDGVKVFYGLRFRLVIRCDNGQASDPCDRGTPGTVEAYLPFFREDGHGTNKPGSAIVLFNPNVDPATARLHFYSCNGDVIETTKGSSYPVVIAGRGNESVPPISTRMRLRDIFIAPGLTQYGNVVIETDMPVGSTLTHRVEGRIYIFADGDDLNTPEGFVLSSQWETSRELWDDFYLSVNSSANQSLFREFIVIQNPHASPAGFQIDFRDQAGDPVVPIGPAPPASGVIPAHGCYAYNTAMLRGCGGAATLQGNATITGTDLPLVGCSVTFGQNACLYPNPDQGEPRLGTDLRTDLRK